MTLEGGVDDRSGTRGSGHNLSDRNVLGGDLITLLILRELLRLGLVDHTRCLHSRKTQCKDREVSIVR